MPSFFVSLVSSLIYGLMCLHHLLLFVPARARRVGDPLSRFAPPPLLFPQVLLDRISVCPRPLYILLLCRTVEAGHLLRRKGVENPPAEVHRMRDLLERRCRSVPLNTMCSMRRDPLHFRAIRPRELCLPRPTGTEPTRSPRPTPHTRRPHTHPRGSIHTRPTIERLDIALLFCFIWFFFLLLFFLCLLMFVFLD